MKRIQISLLLSVVVFATGCPKYSPKVDFKNPNSLVARINEHIGTKRADYESALNANDTLRARRVRNELIEDALPYIDGAYIDFITDLQAGRDRNNFMLDLIELGTAASVGITKGERSLQIIGVALTAFRGGRRSLDANFYKDTSTPILISKMDGNRAKVRTTILTREKASPDDYPLGAALADIVDYYNAGTLVRAFTQLQQDTAVLTQQSEQDVLLLKGVPLTPEITKENHNLRTGAQDNIQRLFRELADPARVDGATTILQGIVEGLEQDSEIAAILKKPEVNISRTEPNGTKIRDALIKIRRSAQLVNNTALLNKIDQVIVDKGSTPAPVATPTPSPSPSPEP